MRKLFLATAMLTFATGIAAAQPPLKICRGGVDKPDTVSSARQYIIGVTSPGAKAFIDQTPAHVYKTGSFGTEIELNAGLNSYRVVVEDNSGKKEQWVKFFYLPAQEAIETPVEQTMGLEEPRNILTKKGAYLQYGNGDDRLGGSKMGFLDENIPLTAVGETENLYKVLLGGPQTAYLPKEYASEGGNGSRVVNSSSAALENIGNVDRLSISLPARVAYSSYTVLEPSTIVVKLYGVTNNTNWLTQRNDTEMVDYIDLRQESDDVLAFHIRLKHNYQWGYSTSYKDNRLVIDIKHKPQSLKLKDLTIGLDAGHGGQYLGAVSPSGLTEKEVNLDIVLKLADMLQKKGAKVVLTRSDDSGPSMAERKQIWRDANVDLAISVHNNASGNPLISMGTSCYYKHLFDRPLADALHKSMLNMGLANFGLTGNFNFSLNGPTEYPNALVEVLFMSSLPDEEVLADPDRRTDLARAILKGIESYLRDVK